MSVVDIPVSYPRDYSLTGPENERAVALGLASAEWYHSEVPRKTMKELMKRSDGPATRDTLLWIGLLIGSATGGIVFWGTWWCVPFWALYGVLYGSACDSRWHECGHGTAFRTAWKNDVVYHIGSFMVMRNPVSWRWSHARHHTDTIIVGRDPEIVFMRPPDFVRYLLLFVGVVDAWNSLKALSRNAVGIITDGEKDYIPESDWPRVVFWARIHMAIYVGAALSALVFASWIPLMLIGLPRLYGCWHMVLCGLLQHGGLAEDVLDHRLNSRTVHLNPFSRFIYWNMNYHVEHHMFPMVPYHALPKLHEIIKDDLPPANTSFYDAYREMIPVLRRQKLEPDYSLRKALPPTAKPYREEFHDVDIARA